MLRRLLSIHSSLKLRCRWYRLTNLALTNWIPKVGELVICLKDEQGWKTIELAFKRGALYKVRGFRHDSKFLGACTVLVEEDSLGSKENGWCLQFFKPASQAAQILYMNKENTNVNGTQTD